MKKTVQDFITYGFLAFLAVAGVVMLADKSLFIFIGALAAAYFFAAEMRQALIVLFGLPVLLFFTGQDFSTILFVATVLCGIAWVVHHYWIRAELPVEPEEIEHKVQTEWAHTVEQAVSFFPILLVIFLFRSFVIEPFRIPSGSMKPTLIEGDFIAVNKFAYGVRLPVIDKKIFDTGEPQRGDVVVFRYPHDPKLDYIKRLVGLPGDRIIYGNKSIMIKPSCKGFSPDTCPKLYALNRTLISSQGFNDNGVVADVYTEILGEREHQLLIRPSQLDPVMAQTGRPIEFIVPEGQYFVMGDNRDGSNDSRFWGFVPDENLKGEAVAIWMHLDFGFDHPLISWVPTGVTFSRIGSIQ